MDEDRKIISGENISAYQILPQCGLIFNNMELRWWISINSRELFCVVPIYLPAHHNMVDIPTHGHLVIHIANVDKQSNNKLFHIEKGFAHLTKKD